MKRFEPDDFYDRIDYLARVSTDAMSGFLNIIVVSKHEKANITAFHRAVADGQGRLCFGFCDSSYGGST